MSRPHAGACSLRRAFCPGAELAREQREHAGLAGRLCADGHGRNVHLGSRQSGGARCHTLPILNCLSSVLRTSSSVTRHVVIFSAYRSRVVCSTAESWGNALCAPQSYGLCQPVTKRAAMQVLTRRPELSRLRSRKLKLSGEFLSTCSIFSNIFVGNDFVLKVHTYTYRYSRYQNSYSFTGCGVLHEILSSTQYNFLAYQPDKRSEEGQIAWIPQSSVLRAHRGSFATTASEQNSASPCPSVQQALLDKLAEVVKSEDQMTDKARQIVAFLFSLEYDSIQSHYVDVDDAVASHSSGVHSSTAEFMGHVTERARAPSSFPT